MGMIITFKIIYQYYKSFLLRNGMYRGITVKVNTIIMILNTSYDSASLLLYDDIVL